MLKNSFILLSCFFLCFCAFSSFILSDCEFPQPGFYSNQFVQSCLSKLPFSEEVRKNAIDNLKKSLPMYAFIDIVKNLPEYNIDLNAEIDKLAVKPYNSDTEFYGDLIKLFQRLQDAHTFFYPPSCYFAFYFLQPFQIISYFDEGTAKNVIEIAKITNGADFSQTFTDTQIMEAYKREYDIDITPEKFVGCKINKINGMTVKDYFLKYLDPIVASAKDEHIRYNMAISKYFTIRQMARFVAPDDEERFLNYQLSCPGTGEVEVSMPWIGYTNKAFRDLSVLARTCATIPIKASGKLADPVIEEWKDSRDKKQFVPQISIKTASPKNMKSEKNEQKLELLFQGDGNNAKFFVATEESGAQFAILKLATFSPSSYPEFIEVILKGTLEARVRNLRRLVIDLTGNGGGEICLGYALAKYFNHMKFQNDFTDNLLGATDMKWTELGSLLAKSGSKYKIFDNVWTSGMWKGENGEDFTGDEWHNQVVMKKRGPNAQPEKFTQFIKEGSCDYLYRLFQIQEPATLSYSPDEIIILTDGYCASTCYLFSSRMMQSKLAKTVVVGGIPKDNAVSKYDAVKFSPNFIPGGQVYELSELVTDVKTFGLEQEKSAPSGLSSSARFRFTLREVYAATSKPHTTSEIPLEFIPKAADFAMYFSKKSALDHNAVYFEVPRFFNTCAAGFTDTETCLNDEEAKYAIYGKECKADGTYSETCKIVGCGENYEFLNGKCSKCPAGKIKKLLTTGMFDARGCYACDEVLPENAKFVDQCKWECLPDFYFEGKAKKCLSASAIAGKNDNGLLSPNNLFVFAVFGVSIVALFAIFGIIAICLSICCFGIGGVAGGVFGGKIISNLGKGREAYVDIEKQSINQNAQ